MEGRRGQRRHGSPKSARTGPTFRGPDLSRWHAEGGAAVTSRRGARAPRCADLVPHARGHERATRTSDQPTEIAWRARAVIGDPSPPGDCRHARPRLRGRERWKSTTAGHDPRFDRFVVSRRFVRRACLASGEPRWRARAKDHRGWERDRRRRWSRRARACAWRPRPGTARRRARRAPHESSWGSPRSAGARAAACERAAARAVPRDRSRRPFRSTGPGIPDRGSSCRGHPWFRPIVQGACRRSSWCDSARLVRRSTRPHTTGSTQ